MVTIVRDRVRALVKEGHDDRSGQARQADVGLRRPLRRQPRLDCLIASSKRCIAASRGRDDERAALCRAVRAGVVLLAALAVTLGLAPAGAQQNAPRASSARAGALIDITGQWVSVVTEDWRWRMVTPPKGDTASVPLNPAGRKAADGWDLAADRARGDLCKAFGPPSLVRQPGRIRIRWEDDNTLLLEFDAGTQTRRFHFDPRTPAARSVQGHSQAKWFRQPQSRGVFGRGAAAAGGSLEAVTTNMRAGYLRRTACPMASARW